MRFVTALPRRAVTVALALLTLGAAALAFAHHYTDHLSERAANRALVRREVQEVLSNLHRDLEMVNTLIASAGHPNDKRVNDYLAARRNELSPVRWLGLMAAPGMRPHMLLGSAVLNAFDPRHDAALNALLARAGTRTPVAGMPEGFRNEAQLALVLSAPQAEGALVALVDVDGLLRDALHELPGAAVHFAMTLDGAPLAQWPTALVKETAQSSVAVTMGEVAFSLDFSEPGWTELTQELWHLPQLALLVSVALLAAWLAHSRPARQLPAPAAPAKAASPRTSRVARLWQLGEATAALAHDLGQPLNVIRLTAEAALDALNQGRADPDRIRRSLTAGIEQTRRMQAMIDALLAATRKPLAPPELVAPAASLHRALDSVQARIAETAARLETAIDPATAKVEGHAARLDAALTQVLLNACEALSAAALAEGAEPGLLRVGCRSGDGEVVISITDSGPGFPPALLATLDAPLPETGGKRCGIGLAIILGVVAEMGGTIAFADAAPGTRVDIRLPAASVGRSLLVAEDEAEAARELADYLTAQGWRVHVAKGGIAALALYGRTRPDAVLTDLHMRNGDGWSLIAALRAQDPDLPIVAITAAQGDDARRAVDAGAVLVLNKPVGLDDVARELDDLLSG